MREHEGRKLRQGQAVELHPISLAYLPLTSHDLQVRAGLLLPAPEPASPSACLLQFHEWHPTPAQLLKCDLPHPPQFPVLHLWYPHDLLESTCECEQLDPQGSLPSGWRAFLDTQYIHSLGAGVEELIANEQKTHEWGDFFSHPHIHRLSHAQMGQQRPFRRTMSRSVFQVCMAMMKGPVA